MGQTKPTPLYVAILWHMHQPLYKDSVTGEYMLPWVRLHAIKDYFDIPALLRLYPEIKQIFNLVPSLLMQLEDYKRGGVKDRFLDVTRKNAAELTADEKVFLLKNFFMANWDRMIRPYPRYWELLQRRGASTEPTDLYRAQVRFSTNDFRDLQVWFNLAWSGNTLMEDPMIRKLVRKGSLFTEEEKRRLLERQDQLLAEIIPLYRSLEQSGQIEISTTPLYHPILPLLCSTRLGKVSDYRTPLPAVEFHYPQDADHQIKEAVRFHERVFGKLPAGLWPSEGSVADEIVPLARRHGLQWMASDQEILRRSLDVGSSLAATQLYQPYQITQKGHRMVMFFRDHALSDRIGFTYSKWDGGDAAQDLVTRLRQIQTILPQDRRRYIVSIILDGENAWEYYPQNGKAFLTRFYELLSREPNIKTTTFSEFLQQEKDIAVLDHLHPGSWIDGNFRTWIGHPEKNRAWELLYEARRFLESGRGRVSEQARESILMAEGSDWFWWYGDDHTTETAAELDYLFRQHLKNVYYYMGESSPPALDQPIKQIQTPIAPVKQPTGMIHPTIDGKVTHFFEWEFAGCYRVGAGQGSMHQADRLIKDIHFGYDPTTLYLRVDTERPLRPSDPNAVRLEFIFQKPGERRVLLAPDGAQAAYRLTIQSPETGEQEASTFRIGKIAEIALPASALGLRDSDIVEFSLTAFQGKNELERWPRPGVIRFVFGPTEMEQNNWYV